MFPVFFSPVYSWFFANFIFCFLLIPLPLPPFPNFRSLAILSPFLLPFIRASPAPPCLNFLVFFSLSLPHFPAVLVSLLISFLFPSLFPTFLIFLPVLPFFPLFSALHLFVFIFLSFHYLVIIRFISFLSPSFSQSYYFPPVHLLPFLRSVSIQHSLLLPFSFHFLLLSLLLLLLPPPPLPSALRLLLLLFLIFPSFSSLFLPLRLLLPSSTLS